MARWFESGAKEGSFAVLCSPSCVDLFCRRHVQPACQRCLQQLHSLPSMALQTAHGCSPGQKRSTPGASQTRWPTCRCAHQMTCGRVAIEPTCCCSFRVAQADADAEHAPLALSARRALHRATRLIMKAFRLNFSAVFDSRCIVALQRLSQKCSWVQLGAVSAVRICCPAAADDAAHCRELNSPRCKPLRHPAPGASS